MEIFSEELKYDRINEALQAINGGRISVCVDNTRKFFYIPTERKIRLEDKTYVISVHDRVKAQGLKIRRGISQTQAQYGDRWVDLGLDFDTERRARSLFNRSGKRFLYVVIEEL